ncbi:hypothetical protein EVAR_24085_1 [Eumeta japonica]|uniref:Retrovirus-related Pol polyprotein from transposon TNT 1-94 n=1 Tax=Eumeta variegata TaxID=151549 RepID=A0A4C1ZWB6_EUMVA|nr:hypothetical protein EVAR_24085_1 [Eumeta japonica]
MEVNNTTNVMKLEGAKNWNVWKFQITVLLRGQGWLDVVEGRTVKPEEAVARATWEVKDAKAQSLMVTRMSEDVKLHIINCTSSTEMWRKLLCVYEQKSETSIHIIQQHFFQYKYEKGVDMSSRASYGDDAISYVQLKRDAHLCTVKCKMCPEHKVHAKLYGCTLIIDEEDDVIVSVVCEDCVASRGGCKHAIAFYFGFTVVARSLLVHQPSAIGKIKVV